MTTYIVYDNRSKQTVKEFNFFGSELVRCVKSNDNYKYRSTTCEQ